MRLPLLATALGMLSLAAFAAGPSVADAVQVTAPAPATAPASAPAAAAAESNSPVGVSTATYHDALTGRDLALTIWYPASGPGTPLTIGGNAVFEGTSGERGAPILPGRHALVLLSHGGLRSAPNTGAWLGKRLARHGYIVVSEDGPTLGPQDAQLAIGEIANRTHDLSGALDAVLANPAWQARIAPDRIAAMGMFLGGTAALSLAGAKVDPAAFARSCDPAAPAPDPAPATPSIAQGKQAAQPAAPTKEASKEGTGLDCAWFRQGGLNLHAADLTPLTGLQRDTRIGFAIAIAPEYAASLSPQSIRDTSVPLAIIDLGAPGDTPEGMQGSVLKDLTPSLTYMRLPTISRFDAFTQCTPKGAAILKDSGSDAPICDDSGTARDAAHAVLAGMVRALLDRGLN